MKTNRFKLYHITAYWIFSLKHPQVQLGLSFAFACTTIKLLFFEISFWHIHNVHDHHFLNLDTEHESLKKYDKPLTKKLFQIATDLGYEDNNTSVGIEMTLEEDTLEIEANLFLAKKLSPEEITSVQLREDVKFNMAKAKEEYSKLKWFQKIFPQLAPSKTYEN